MDGWIDLYLSLGYVPPGNSVSRSRTQTEICIVRNKNKNKGEKENMNIGINIAYINKQWKLLVDKIRQPNVYTTQYNSQWWMIWCGIIWASLVHWVFDDITAELLCSQCATVSNCGVFIVVVRFVWQSQQGTNKISICNKTSVTVLFAIQCENLLLYNRPLSSEAYLKLI